MFRRRRSTLLLRADLDAAIGSLHDIAGQTVPVLVTLTDAVARTLSGYEMVTVSDSGGQLGLTCAACIFNVNGTITYGGAVTASAGGSVSVMGDEVSIEQALAAITDTLGSSGTISVHEWNEGGFERTLTLTSTVGANPNHSTVPGAP